MAIHTEFDKGRRAKKDAANSKCTAAYTSMAANPGPNADIDTGPQSIWFATNEREHGIISLKDLSQIDQNSAAVAAIASVLTKSISEPDGTDCASLDTWTTICMLGAIKSICSFNVELIDRMRHEAS